VQLEFSGRRYPVATDELIIGSDPAATVLLPAPGVLPRHAVVRLMREGMAVVEPGVPGAEILLNGSPLGADPTPIMHGDKLRIGGQDIAVADPRRAGQTDVTELPDSDLLIERNAPPEPERPGFPPVTIEHVVDPRAAPAPRLVSLVDGREYRVEVVPFVLGRDAVSEVVVEAGEVSRRHAEIVTRADGDVLVDLSSNGTYINGERIESRRVLKNADVIRIGDEEFRYYATDRPLPAPGAAFRLADTMHGFQAYRPPVPTPFLPASEPALATLAVRQGDLQGQRLDVRTPVVNIGRAEFNDLKLPDSSVSASHAKLQLREGVWVLSDLGSTNGVTVDGVRVEGEVALSPGATIVLGQVRLQFEPRDEGIQGQPRTSVLSPEALEQARKGVEGQPPLPRRHERPARGSASRTPLQPGPGRSLLSPYLIFAAAVLVIALLVWILL
jgi:pSer/pThr/pTyr-binding forkhead associated (FHA) protein